MRLDAYLVTKGIIRSRERAKSAIKAGRVQINGETVTRATRIVKDEDHVVCEGDLHDYVSRGALKLVAGLEAFKPSVDGAICLDLGASTGGFTEVLLRARAQRVYAVDVGTDQLHHSLRKHPRVISLENTHSKSLTSTLVPDPLDIIVCDVSFISIMKALPPAMALAAPKGKLLTLVKPQFELGRDALGKGGIVTWSVKEQADWVDDTIIPWFEARGWEVDGVIDSPIKGSDGNHEFLVGAHCHG